MQVFHVRETLEKCCIQELQGACMQVHGACKGYRANAWSFMSHAKTLLSCSEGVLKVARRNSEIGIRKQHP